MAYWLGVDLGTSYTAAATSRDGDASIVTLGDRAPVLPSVVFLRDDGATLIGVEAERRAAVQPERVAREFKRRIGDPTPLLLGGTPFAPEALQADLLRRVVAIVTERMGEAPARIALTHPANWGPYKLDLLAETARLAGVIDPVMLSEPEAAAWYYASQQRVEPGENIAVYDLGGGTFDAAILRRTQTGYELVGTPTGIEHLGGVDVDEAVMAHVRQSLGADFDELDPSDPSVTAMAANLRRDCIDAKEALSSDTDATVVVTLPSGVRQVRLTRGELEAMISPSLGRTVEGLQRALDSAGIGAADVRAVLLVGGSSRIPLVAQLVTGALGRPVAVDTHPKHAVALGAALAAEASAGHQPDVPADIPVAPVGVPTPAAAAPSPPPPPPPPAAAPPPPPQEPRRKRRGVAILVAFALIAGIVGAVVLLRPKEAAASEVFLEPKNSTGSNPFTSDLSKRSPDRLPTTTTTAPTGTSSGATNLVSRSGTEPGLYGGTRDSTSCDQAEMIQFLNDNPDKAAAWASVESISTSELESYISNLTPVVLLADTRVTNHGFRDGRATALQSVLQAGTAVLIDDAGVPLAKCACGNPLLPPVAARGATTQRGDPWPGFDPAAAVVVTPGATTNNVTLIDTNTGIPFERPVGTDGGGDIDAPPDVVAALTVDLGGASTTTTSTTSPIDPIDITSQGIATASTEFPDGLSPASFAIDSDETTSWFSAGPSAAGTSVFTWRVAGSHHITAFTLVSNGSHATPEFRRNFGFGHVDVIVKNGSTVVFETGVDLAGTPDPTITVDPDVDGNVIELTFTGHEDPNQECGGFAELYVIGV